MRQSTSTITPRSKLGKHTELGAGVHLAEDGGKLKRGAASPALQVKRCGAAALPSEVSEGSAAPAQGRFSFDESPFQYQSEVSRLGARPTSLLV